MTSTLTPFELENKIASIKYRMDIFMEEILHKDMLRHHVCLIALCLRFYRDLFFNQYLRDNLDIFLKFI